MRVLNNNSVQGDGFTIAVRDIHAVSYEENDRTATVEIEGGMDDGEVDFLVYSETLDGWYVAGAWRPMSAEDKSRVLSKISDALNLLKIRHRLD